MASEARGILYQHIRCAAGRPKIRRAPSCYLDAVVARTHSHIIHLSGSAWCELYEGFVPAGETRGLFDALREEVPFAQRPIFVFGREVMQPRLSAWIGDPEAVYRYSNVVHTPLPFGATLEALRKRVAELAGMSFNSVLCNLYRDGNDAMGMHSDSEPELGPEPVIASLSLGAERRFVLRARQRDAHAGCELTLADGSLLVMRGSMQREFKHGVPRERGVRDPRINLTFRRILAG